MDFKTDILCYSLQFGTMPSEKCLDHNDFQKIGLKYDNLLKLSWVNKHTGVILIKFMLTKSEWQLFKVPDNLKNFI